MHSYRLAGEHSLDQVIAHIFQDLELHGSRRPEEDEPQSFSPFIGEAILGHLRYATHSGSQIQYCQPFVRSHAVPFCQLAIAGNFNLTNTSDLFYQLNDWGLALSSQSDTQVILSLIGHHLDQIYASQCVASNDHVPHPTAKLDFSEALKRAAAVWDGGYVFCGLAGTGDVFACRDPAGIRPCYCLINEEVVAIASERVALMEVFDVAEDKIVALRPGHILLVQRSGEITETRFKEALPERQCSFERIYFSKATDPQIYQERKALGKNLAQQVWETIGGDIEHTVFTYVPNSSVSAFQGLVEEIEHLSRRAMIQEIQEKHLSSEQIEKLLSVPLRAEAIITKNQKVRTFISSAQKRKNQLSQLYEVTGGIVKSEDTLVVVDDSIIRGVTLRDFLVRKLIKLNPKKIIIVSSAPPAMYPDCYGIDMSQLGNFVAFQAAIALLKERKQEKVLDEVHALCAQQESLPAAQKLNAVKKIYDLFTLEEISAKVAKLITPSSPWRGSIQVIYQSLDGLHRSMPGFSGDWYFSGDYPTPGGFNVLNNSYLKWYRGDHSRSY